MRPAKGQEWAFECVYPHQIDYKTTISCGQQLLSLKFNVTKKKRNNNNNKTMDEKEEICFDRNERQKETERKSQKERNKERIANLTKKKSYIWKLIQRI